MPFQRRKLDHMFLYFLQTLGLVGMVCQGQNSSLFGPFVSDKEKCFTTLAPVEKHVDGEIFFRPTREPLLKGKAQYS
jgi:hypothetical protein